MREIVNVFVVGVQLLCGIHQIFGGRSKDPLKMEVNARLHCTECIDSMMKTASPNRQSDQPEENRARPTETLDDTVAKVALFMRKIPKEEAYKGIYRQCEKCGPQNDF